MSSCHPAKRKKRNKQNKVILLTTIATPYHLIHFIRVFLMELFDPFPGHILIQLEAVEMDG